MKSIFVLGLVLMVFAGVAQKPDGYNEELEAMYKNTVPRISALELEKEMKKNPDLVLLDTREKAEYNVSHLLGARNVGYDKFSLKSVADISKDAQIIVYCSLGVRSERIGEQLQKAGFTNVQNLYGGIFEWVYADMVVVDKKGLTTNQVHTYDENWSKWLIRGEKIY